MKVGKKFKMCCSDSCNTGSSLTGSDPQIALMLWWEVWVFRPLAKERKIHSTLSDFRTWSLSPMRHAFLIFLIFCVCVHFRCIRAKTAPFYNAVSVVFQFTAKG